jgi:hypothetical protein
MCFCKRFNNITVFVMRSRQRQSHLVLQKFSNFHQYCQILIPPRHIVNVRVKYWSASRGSVHSSSPKGRPSCIMKHSLPINEGFGSYSFPHETAQRVLHLLGNHVGSPPPNPFWKKHASFSFADFFPICLHDGPEQFANHPNGISRISIDWRPDYELQLTDALLIWFQSLVRLLRMIAQLSICWKVPLCYGEVFIPPVSQKNRVPKSTKIRNPKEEYKWPTWEEEECVCERQIPFANFWIGNAKRS